MKSPMYSVPLKTLESVDWSKALRSYLRSHYGEGLDLDANIEEFQRARTDLQGVHADATGRDLYYRYYGQLALLDLRLVRSTLPHINFVWHDAFNPSDTASQSTLAFEKANILFNLGAILSGLGLTAMGEANYREAYAAYQQAAGVFEYVGESFLHAPSDDLGVTTLEALAKLMLAQAQEVFILKMVSEGKTNTALFPRLVQGCGVLYGHAHRLMETASTPHPSATLGKSTRTNFPVELVPYLYTKSYFYLAAANYHQALVLETTKPGEAIAYLKVATGLMRDHCNKHTLVEHKEFLETLKAYHELLRLASARMEKDNDFVYHAAVPAAASLAEIKPMESVNPLPVTQHPAFVAQSLEMKDLFEKIIPMDVHELNSLYSEEKAQLMRAESETIEMSNEILSSILEYLNLPRALHELKQALKAPEVPETDPRVLSMAYEICHGVNIFEERDKTAAVKKRVYDSLALVEAAVRSDRFQELTGIKRSLLEATENDNRFALLLQPVSKDLEFLCKYGDQPEALKRHWQTGSPTDEPSLIDAEEPDTTLLQAKVNALEEHLSDLSNLRQERAKLYDSLKRLTIDDDISQILILNKKALSTNGNLQSTIFNDALVKYKPYQDRIQMNVTKQAQLITALKQSWNGILAEPAIKQHQKAASELALQLARMLERMQRVFAAWQEVVPGLVQGGEYYTQFLGHLQTLGQGAEGRRPSAQAAFASDLSSRFSLLSVGEATAKVSPVIPARPDRMTAGYGPQTGVGSPQGPHPSMMAPTMYHQERQEQPGLHYRPAYSAPPVNSGHPSLQAYPGQAQPQAYSEQSQPRETQLPGSPKLIYNEPSVFDRSLYTSYAPAPPLAQHPPQPPQSYTHPNPSGAQYPSLY